MANSHMADSDSSPSPFLAPNRKKQPPFSGHELPSSSTAALIDHSPKRSDSTSILKPPSSAVVFIALLLSAFVALSAALALGFFFFYSAPSSTAGDSTALSKLNHPVVLLISCDGFRFGYQYKADTPNIDRLIKNGTEAELGLIPVFPTLTFPNHYSIVTGLYPESHGIVNNYFSDPSTGDRFTMQSHEPSWWLGEPLWEVVVRNGLKAATYFWPGSEVKKGSWDCPEGYCMHYNSSVPFGERVDTILSYFDLPGDEIPSFMTLYFEDPDHQGHRVGPDDPWITEAIAEVDGLVGRLINGLEARGVFDDMTIILLGDHGMVGTCDKKLIFLDDLAKWVRIPEDWVQSYAPLFSITPPRDYSNKDIVDKMNEGLKSGEV